ncbi:MAG: glycosyltransferase [Hyphomicrobiaceae bacterium]
MSPRQLAKQFAIAAAYPILRVFAGRPPKKISAMLRVKNEIEFLERSIKSVVDSVDELVVVDNLSTDGSADVIANLSKLHPDKIRAYNYPHEMARYGEEMEKLAAMPNGMKSPSFLPNFYNWCADKCTCPYILKWDGDTIATKALAPTLDRFRHSNKQALWHTGVNLHADRASFIAGRPFEDMEPRLFYKRFSTYNNYLGYCEALWSPYVFNYPSFIEKEFEPLYFHMKWCKIDRYSNMSNNLQISHAALSGRGAPLPEYLREQVNSLGL